jgi:hypothetical protein
MTTTPDDVSGDDSGESPEVPVDLVELFEVLEWEAAVAAADSDS